VFWKLILYYENEFFLMVNHIRSYTTYLFNKTFITEKVIVVN